MSRWSRTGHHPDPVELRDLLDHVGLVSQLGAVMAAAVGLGLGLGYYLDRWTGLNGLCTLVFLLLGVASGYRAVYQVIKKIETRRKGDR